ncbi:hypothetical protein QWJ34_07585 [Saccharibacillus sp. CPCC 101409]|uniref:hypothetical protein n=1 Tax=Saccharibacillus sp. CPCC 101409 TaxID=3058041 RepID=UPI002670D9C5|nr:hypothetical protein [Saccharibacillus sp. CPCC 101409]MDO3409621.1 hypothetical protein [Saccharibacillus sp. CPCC 101409]
MERLSDSVKRNMEELLERKKSGDTAQAVRLLGQIGRSDQCEAAAALLPFLYDEEPDIAAAAESALGRLLESCPPDGLVRLDEQSRLGSGRLWQVDTPPWREAQAAVLSALDGAGFTRLALASFHRSGFVREQAVLRLGSLPGGKGLPFLLLRMNDWVRQIRRQSQRSLESRLLPEFADDWLASTELVLRLLQCSRDSFGPFVEAVAVLLRRAECAPALNRAMGSPRAPERRFAFRCALEAEAASPAEVLGRALSAADPWLRLWAARLAAKRLFGSERTAALETMLRDPLPAVRREALDELPGHDAGLAETVLQAALLDRSPAVRETARRQLDRLDPGGNDYALLYLDAIWNGDERRLPQAVAGLGETGSAADAEVLLDYAGHLRPAVRKAVLRAWTLLGADEYARRIALELRSPQPGVSRAAAEALLRHPHWITAEELLEILSDEANPHVRRNALRLLPRLGRWKQLLVLLRRLPSADDEDEESLVRRQLSGWIKQPNRSYADFPSEAERGELLGALEAGRRKLTQQEYRSLQWLIPT